MVSRRLLRLEMEFLPDRQMFCVRDPGTDRTAPGGPPLPDGSLITAVREQMLVACAQQQVAVGLILEEWDGAPPPFGGDYEDEAKCVLYLRGAVAVDAGAGGQPVAVFCLTGGVGNYGVRVYTRNRAEVLRRSEELIMVTDPLGDDFTSARRQLDGFEQYLIQIWRES